MAEKHTKTGGEDKSYSKLQNDVKNKIDHSVFEDNTISPNEYYTPRTSTTIDTSILSSPIRGSKTRTRTASTRYHDVERYYPSIENGLSNPQVQARVNQGLANVVTDKSGITYSSIFFKNIFTWFNMLTFAVAIALLVVDLANITKCVFMLIVLVNITIGIVQEIKSKRTVDKLKLMTAPSAFVIRNGEKVTIPVDEIVLDDIIYLEMGKQICTDCVLIRGECEVNESMLTGESVPVKKKQGDEMYSGSFVSSGSCYARVTRVGDLNYVAKLVRRARKYKKPKSELHNSIELVIKIVSFVIIPVAILMINWGVPNVGLNLTVQQAGGAVIGMIPSGMFLLTSIALASSVVKLSKRNTMVRDLYCIEMLARVDTLCLDKTGTITDGTMQVHSVIECKNTENNVPVKDVISSMLSATEDNNQTAIALGEYFSRSQVLKPVTVMPFSSQKKLSAVTFEDHGTYLLGAPEFVLRDMSAKHQKAVAEYARNGYRVMLLAHSPTDIKEDRLPALRKAIAFIIIEDHIRPEAADTIKWFKENGVAIKVISGDSPITVSEVARKVGVQNAEKFISLEGMSSEQVRACANKYTVFGRVTPEQKRILVKEMKAEGHTVAMTGDGVNDILALREADCSVAMASGSEAARNVSHLVLMDSNFSSMPAVVKEGRRVINNIQNSSSLYLMKTFMSVVLAVLSVVFAYCNISNSVYFFDTTNLMPLEMCIIGLPSIFLALQPNDSLVEGRFLGNVAKKCLPGGIALVIAVLSVYVYQRFNLASGIPAGLTFNEAYPEAYMTMLVVSVVYTGFMSLVVICRPFDRFRVGVCAMTFAIATLALTVVLSLLDLIGLGTLFGENVTVFFNLDLQFLTYLSTIIFVNYFVILFVTKAIHTFDDKKGENKNGNQTA